MPFTDDFVTNYAGYQDDPTPYFNEPVGGCTVGANSCVDIANTYNPLKTTGNRRLYAINYSGAVQSEGAGIQAICQFKENTTIDRNIITYNESVSAWDGTETLLNLVADPFTITNNTLFDIFVRGVELMQAAGPTTNEIRNIELTRAGSRDGFPLYTTTENIFFNRSSRMWEPTTGPVYFHSSAQTNLSEFIPTSQLPGTATNGQTIDMQWGGTYSLARYNFPQNYALAPGESIPLNLGSIQLSFNTNVITI